MPIRTQSDLPAKEILEQENIFVMDESRAMHQDIRPINIVILNLMPLKEETELQIFRSLSNTPLQVDVSLLAPAAFSQEEGCEAAFVLGGAGCTLLSLRNPKI